jgi:hypothetical protein
VQNLVPPIADTGAQKEPDANMTAVAVKEISTAAHNKVPQRRFVDADVEQRSQRVLFITKPVQRSQCQIVLVRSETNGELMQ